MTAFFQSGLGGQRQHHTRRDVFHGQDDVGSAGLVNRFTAAFERRVAYLEFHRSPVEQLSLAPIDRETPFLEVAKN